MMENRSADKLVSGARSALIHFGKAAVEIVSGISVFALSVADTVRPSSDDSQDGSERPQKIEIE